MLRVGLNSPPSTNHPFLSFRTVLQCGSLPHLSGIFQFHLVSFSAPLSRLAASRNDATQKVKEELKPLFPVKKPRNPPWKKGFIRNIELPKSQHVSQQSEWQDQPSTSGTQASPMEARANRGVPRIIVHPFHRRAYVKQVKSSTEPLVEGSHPCGSLQTASPQRCIDQDSESAQSRDTLLCIISETKSVSHAWEAYNTLLAMQKHRPVISHDEESLRRTNVSNGFVIPYTHLHRLARLLASTHPRTRQLFLRLLSVLTTLRTTGGRIFVWEWNALVDCAGKGWRKTRIEDYRAAVDIFKDMVTSSQTVSSLPRDATSEGQDGFAKDSVSVAKPDIVTLTTLLDIASRTLNEKAILHAMSLLAASGLPWNNVTHMARLPYFIHTNQLPAVRGILSVGVTRGLDLATLNGCLWAYAHQGRLRIAMQVYDFLRQNVPAQDRADLGEQDRVTFSLDPKSHIASSDQEGNPFLVMPGFIEQATMVPDAVTYTLLVQALCYHGDLIGALTVFRDMVSTVDRTSQPMDSRSMRAGEGKQAYYKPSCAIYRAIFLGFARHAHRKSTLASSLILRQQGVDSVPLPEFAARLSASPNSNSVRSPSLEEVTAESPWSLKNLESIFTHFLEMGWEVGGVQGEDVTTPTRPSDRLIYWIMVAYAKTTERDVQKMYGVWKQLVSRFELESAGVTMGGRLSRVAKELEERTRTQ